MQHEGLGPVLLFFVVPTGLVQVSFFSWGSFELFGLASVAELIIAALKQPT